jgi:transcriptional regulator with XRE-family HTH domain
MNQTVPEIIRARIRRLRRHQGLTQEALCERAGLSPDAVTRIESGSRTPTIDTLVRIAAALGVAVEDLLRGAARERPPRFPTIGRIAALLERQPLAVQQQVELVVRAVVQVSRIVSTERRRPRR